MQKYSKIIAVSFFLFSSFAWGQSYQLGTATFSGNGCPSGSAAVSVSPDGSAISFLFDRFSAQTVGNHMAGAVSCVVQIPLTVTSGYVVDATYLDFRGFAALPVFDIHSSGQASGAARRHEHPRPRRRCSCHRNAILSWSYHHVVKSSRPVDCLPAWRP
jgi:hypothetical protein